MTFEQLGIIKPILSALEKEGYKTPTEIQSQAIPLLLSGKDLLATAQTGTGKTAAFAIPILQKLTEKPSDPTKKRIVRSLVIAPTRELAAQIGASFKGYGRGLSLRTTVVFGGVSKGPQIANLRAGTDILIATPGRLLDFMNDHLVDISLVEVFVMDEADQMLDMGFMPDVRKIVSKLPRKRQSMMFSATFPKEIEALATNFFDKPVRLHITPVEKPIESIDQTLYFVAKSQKSLLLLHLLQDKKIKSALVFTRTKHGANKLEETLYEAGVNVSAIHGNKSQPQRVKALNDFKSKNLRVLVATDVASRGIDIDQLSHVVIYDLPEVPETYLHRMGRTGRAGFSGSLISFCSLEELSLLKDIERHIGMKIPVIKDHPFVDVAVEAFQTASTSSSRHRPSNAPSVGMGRPKPSASKNWRYHSGGTKR